MNKSKKWLAFLFSVLIVMSYYYWKKDILYIILNDKITRIQIPREIVKAQDCTAYKEWFDERFTPILVTSDRCPWTKPPKGPIAEFVLNGVNFYVPREYLWQDFREPDGEVDSIHVMFKYPDMSPANGGEKVRDYNILVTLRSTGKRIPCIKNDICDQVGQEWYEHITHIYWNNQKGKLNIIEKLYELPENDLIAYSINDSEEYLIKGDPSKPDYWIRCSPDSTNAPNPGCETCLNYNKKIYIDYSFNRRPLLNEHQDIRRKIVEKINQFQFQQNHD